MSDTPLQLITTTISLHLSFILSTYFEVCLCSGPHRPLSSWHYKLTFATTKQLEHSLSGYKHANTQRHTDLLPEMQQECQQEHERGHPRIQNDSLVPLSHEG